MTAHDKPMENTASTGLKIIVEGLMIPSYMWEGN